MSLHPSPSLFRPLLGVLLSAAVLVIGLVACDSSETPSPEGSEAPVGGSEAGSESEVDAAAEATSRREALAAPVDVVRLERADFRDRIELIGELQPVRSATVVSEAPGRILAIRAEEGDRVEARQDLVRVDVAQQEASLRQLEVQLAQVERDIERNERLVRTGLGTTAAIEQLESQRDALREQRQQLRLATGQARTRAPMGGIVVERMAEPGEYAQPGQALLRIADLGTMKVLVGVPEQDVRYLAAGDPVQVLVRAQERVVEGRIHRIGVEIDERNRSYPVEIRIDNEEGALRGGMRTLVTLTRRVLEGALIIPLDAVVQGFDDRYVMVVEGERVAQRPVVLGPTLGPWVVATQGLEDDETIAVRGHRALVEGDRVRVDGEEVCCGERFRAFEAERATRRQGAGQ